MKVACWKCGRIVRVRADGRLPKHTPLEAQTGKFLSVEMILSAPRNCEGSGSEYLWFQSLSEAAQLDHAGFFGKELMCDDYEQYVHMGFYGDLEAYMGMSQYPAVREYCRQARARYEGKHGIE